MDRSVDKAELKAFNDELESLGCQVRKLLNQIRPDLNLTSDQTRWSRSQGTVWPPFVRFLHKCLIFPQLISKLWCKIYRCVLNWFVQCSASTQVGFPIISDKSLTFAKVQVKRLLHLFNIIFCQKHVDDCGDSGHLLAELGEESLLQRSLPQVEPCKATLSFIFNYPKSARWNLWLNLFL